MKQVKIYDVENDVYQGGILLDNGDVICGCCGGLLKAEDKTWRLIEEYKNWINLSYEICGDDLPF